MRVISWRLQSRHCAAVAGIVVLVSCFVCLHLLGEVSRLEHARERLETAIAKLQNNHVGVGHPRHLSATNDQVEITGTGLDEGILIYNRIPKTGSTSFAGIAYDLCKRNKFNVLHVNTTKNAHVLSLSDQMRFVHNITEWESKKPAMYHGHFAYVEFGRFAAGRRPLYINIIRNPIHRLVSYFYFVRHGDDFRPYLKRRKAGNNETFDECVEKEGSDCDAEHLWLQIPFFCGQDAECWNPGSNWALEKAKLSVIQNYLLVGVTEELGDFLTVLEAVLPRYFRGAVKLYSLGRRSHLRRTANKIVPKQSSIAKVRQSHIWRMEQDFYNFVQEQFHFVKQSTFDVINGEYVEKGNNFHYEKIRPR